MSTIFGVILPQKDEPIEVAFRTSSSTSKTGVNIKILNPLVLMLPDETLLKALDNSNQGIYTVKDLKWYLKEQEE
jgi:hypothetical protein